MLFLLEPGFGEMKFEYDIVKNVLRNTRQHDFETVGLENIGNGLWDRYKEKAIPIGSLQYVQKWMQHFFQIDRLNPMEIPFCLQSDYYLKRKYEIVSYDELPVSGCWFIKDVSEMKSMTHIGNKIDLLKTADPEHIYQCSEYVQNIRAEYRLYFIGGKLENVCNYYGDPACNIDFDLVLSADKKMKTFDNYPRSYIMDVMVTPRGTALIELHPFVGIGLYSTLWGENLLNAYADGIHYLRYFNTPCTEGRRLIV